MRQKSESAILHQHQFHEGSSAEFAGPEFEKKSLSKSKYADSVVELDTRIGRLLDKLRELGLDKNTLVFYTTDNGAWQDVYPDAGYTPFRGTKGTVREGGNRVPAIAAWPGKIKEGVRNHDIIGGLDLMATFAAVAGVKLPEKDREGQPIMFDSYDMTPVLTGTGKSARNAWFSSPKMNSRPARLVWATTKRSSIFAGIMAKRLEVWRSIAISVGKARKSTSPRFRRSLISGKIRKNATISL